MKVYIVTKYIAYEGDEVIQVFKSPEAAEELVSRLTNSRGPYAGVYWKVHEWEVSE